MAIGFARVEFVQRSNGKTACAKAAYNARTRIEFEGNCALDPDVYNWSLEEKPAEHAILLPEGVNPKFKDPQTLWNTAEAKERKVNSQVAMEVVLALPDDKMVTLEDRIFLTQSFVQTHFVDKGLAAQIDIHSPERKIQITRDNREQSLFKGMKGNVLKQEGNLLTVQFDKTRTIVFDHQEFTGFVEKENNWHAHVLVTTRRFKANGLELEDHKARDLMPRVCNGKVVSGPDWGKLWTDHQNQYFQDKGLNLRVDSLGIEPQEHLGPVRMRGRAFDLLDEHSRLLDENATKSKNPSQILEKLTQRQSVFTNDDLERFLQKHLPFEDHDQIRKEFWEQKEVVLLVDKITGEVTGKYSSQKVVEEEKRIVRLADQLQDKQTFKIDAKNSDAFSKTLNEEQRKAFSGIIAGQKLICLQGYAGTGKSYLLGALRDLYLSAGYKVRGFGPDSATADVLKEKGFHNAENIYRFLFGVHNSRRQISKGKEVWILDEAGKLGNAPLLELLKTAEKNDVKLIFSGDHAQLTSVGRGGMFRLFCERYSSFVLADIQRQKNDKQREVAKDLAIGNAGSAVDKLSSASSIQWSATKKEAIETLISKWASDTRAHPRASTLLIAHTNDETRVLNEMVRIVRKQRGELSEREFSCNTSLGKVYLSIGDRIEFRQNDKELGVTNGLSGVLVEAEPDKFIVSIGENERKTRLVVFDPQKYHSYQLGYSSTYFRSQGRTIDRAYVLHSPSLNKRLFYVGLTRHVNEAYYFISKDQAYCLADLKRQASREDIKESAIAYATLEELQIQEKLDQKQIEIQQLKDSDSFLSKLKGYGLSAYDLVKTKTASVRERVHDRKPSEEFFHVKVEKSVIKGSVQEEVKSNNSSDVNVGEMLKPILSQESIEANQENRSVSNVGQPEKNSVPELLFARSKDRNLQIWEALGSEKQNAFEEYFLSAGKAATLHSVTELEMEGSPRELSSAGHFKEWQDTCSKRNALAYALTQKVNIDELKTFLGKKTAQFVQEQCLRHQTSIERSQKATDLNIQEKLQDNLEPLLYRLFPSGPTRKDRTSFRFGAKGSLCVKVAGEKAGQYFDFERQEGGNAIKLIQRELGLGRLEAQQWAKDFLGVSKDVKAPKSFQRVSEGSLKESDWIAQKPSANTPAPRLEDLTSKKLHHFYDEVARHAYRDENGDLLYYRLRLRDKQDPSKKITPPLSFGHWKSDPGKVLWALKGFDSGKAVLYNLPHLKEKPLAPVLIVEGEKTADLAGSKFPGENFVYITWPGGAGAVKKADWVPLAGRNIFIWPDNDRAGFQAADDLSKELRKIGVQSLRMINPLDLQKNFPEKWDLADPLPHGVSSELSQQLLLGSIHKGIDPQRALLRVSAYGNTFAYRMRANEILWRVDERLRPELEQKFGNQFWKIDDVILNETARILLRDNQRIPTHEVQSSKLEEIQRRLNWQALVHEARHGKEPHTWEIEKFHQIIEPLTLSKRFEEKDKNLADLALDQALSSACEKTFGRSSIDSKSIGQATHVGMQDLSKQSQKHETLALTQQQNLARDSSAEYS
jgi:Ti-type conjugative transfer relaxase TraA